MVAAVPADAVGNTGMADMNNPYCAHYPGSAAVMGGAGELAAAQKMVVDDTFAMRYPNMGKTSVITITWDAPTDGGSDITGYTVQSKYGDMDFMDATVKALAMNDTTVVHTGLKPNTTYTYQVRATNAIGDGAWSMEDMAMTDDIVPNAPTVTAMADGRTMINVSWEAGADNGGSAVTAYSLQKAYMMSDGMMGDWTDVDLDDAMATSYAHMDLMPGTKVYYQVAATNGAGMSDYSEAKSAMTAENMMPTAGADIDDVMATEGDDPIMVQSTITDGDDAMLDWTVSSDHGDVAAATVDDMGMVTITIGHAGTATITVTATDMFDASDMQSFDVTVESAVVPMPTMPTNVQASNVGTRCPSLGKTASMPTCTLSC